MGHSISSNINAGSKPLGPLFAGLSSSTGAPLPFLNLTLSGGGFWVFFSELFRGLACFLAKSRNMTIKSNMNATIVAGLKLSSVSDAIF